MLMRLCNRCNQWGETAEPCTCTEDLIEADQDIAYLRQQLAAAEQRAEQAEKQIVRLHNAASCIKHWHDAYNGGMVVSGSHVLDLWDVLDDIRNRYPQHFKGE